MNDFERVVVRIVEVGAAAGEDAFVALVLAEHVHPLGLELGHRRIVGVAVDHEGVVDDVGKPPAAGVAAEYDIVGAGFEEHEMRIFLRYLGHELEAENVSVEGAAAGEVAHRNRHVQNAFGLDHASPPLQRRHTPTRGTFSIDSLEKISRTFNPTYRKRNILPNRSTIEVDQKPTPLRMFHGTFSCRNRSMTR